MTDETPPAGWVLEEYLVEAEWPVIMRVRTRWVPPRVCPTCHGSGLVWRGTSSKRRGRINEDGESCMAAFRCPTCPQDMSQPHNSVGTGRVQEAS